MHREFGGASLPLGSADDRVGQDGENDALPNCEETVEDRRGLTPSGPLITFHVMSPEHLPHFLLKGEGRLSTMLIPLAHDVLCDSLPSGTAHRKSRKVFLPGKGCTIGN